jgi:hypothetical protein
MLNKLSFYNGIVHTSILFLESDINTAKDILGSINT